MVAKMLHARARIPASSALCVALSVALVICPSPRAYAQDPESNATDVYVQLGEYGGDISVEDVSGPAEGENQPQQEEWRGVVDEQSKPDDPPDEPSASRLPLTGDGVALGLGIAAFGVSSAALALGLLARRFDESGG